MDDVFKLFDVAGPWFLSVKDPGQIVRSSPEDVTLCAAFWASTQRRSPRLNSFQSIVSEIWIWAALSRVNVAAVHTINQFNSDNFIRTLCEQRINIICRLKYKKLTRLTFSVSHRGNIWILCDCEHTGHDFYIRKTEEYLEYKHQYNQFTYH